MAKDMKITKLIKLDKNVKYTQNLDECLMYNYLW